MALPCKPLSAAIALLLPFIAVTAVGAPSIPDASNLPARELRQMQDDWHRGRIERETESLKERRGVESTPEPVPAEPPAAGFQFDLTAIGHTPSLVLTDEEFDAAVSPWIGRRIRVEEIADILNAVNARYRERGYVVCQAVVKPQRISGGRLEVTLIEGRTESVTVVGNDSTRESFITRAFDLKPSEVANYRVMIEDLVRFNMTNDVALRVDIGAGEAPESTAYRIIATEPARWTGSVFADTTGSESTGRPRIGATIANRSLFGVRDSLTLLGLASEGSKSGMLGYSIPLTSFGTRLSGTVSYGKIEVIDGPSEALDVTGESFMASLRLEHPVWVTSRSKTTIWGEASHQKSNSDMFGGVRVAETAINAYSAGADAFWFGESSVISGTAAVTRHEVDEKIFGKQTGYQLFTGNLAARHNFANGLALSWSGRWQSRLGGDELNSADYFYLGHSSGVRGYDNDILSAPSGFVTSVEASYPIAGDSISLYAFFDAGRLTGERVSEERRLYSTGLGLSWTPFEGAAVNGSVSFPLKRELADDADVSRARADLSIVMTW